MRTREERHRKNERQHFGEKRGPHNEHRLSRRHGHRRPDDGGDADRHHERRQWIGGEENRNRKQKGEQAKRRGEGRTENTASGKDVGRCCIAENQIKPVQPRGARGDTE